MKTLLHGLVTGFVGFVFWLCLAWVVQSQAQFGPLPTYTALPANQSLTTPVITGNVTGIYTLLNPTIVGALLTTAPTLPVMLPGDFSLGKEVTPSVAPGFGALTLRVRQSQTIPGACMLVAVAGSSTIETIVKDPIGQGC